MASIKKFTHAAMDKMFQHNNREIEQSSNQDIDITREGLNYSFPLNHGNLSDFKYYHKLINAKYLYGRGTQREKNAITGCGWVVTLPRELYGNPEKEKAFFKGVFDFISLRYGEENIINNHVHYDEGGLPHIHIIFCPVTTLNHEIVQHKTQKTSQFEKLPSGRYEYKYKFILDDKGEKIRLKNYAKKSDYYDEKIDANSVLNKIELLNFHPDLQKYLISHGIEGTVITGKTGTNFTVKELKEFTANTGLHLDEVKEMQGDKSLLESFVEHDARVHSLEQIVEEKNLLIESLQEKILSRDTIIDRIDRSDEISHKDEQIKNLSHIISEKIQELEKAIGRNLELERKLAEMEKAIEAKQCELERAQVCVEELKKKTNEISQTQEQGWGHFSSSWGDKAPSPWNSKTTTFEEEIIR